MSGLNYNYTEIHHLDSGFHDWSESSFQYDVWINSPRSVEERRGKFLDWMGLSLDGVSPENSVDAPCLEGEFDRAMETSDAVLRTSGFEEEFSSTRSSMSCWSNDNFDLFGKSSSGDNFVCREGNEVASCDVDRVQQDEKASEGCEMSEEQLGTKFLRVKVQQSRKKRKEFSALYKGQDIQAHEGTIFTMKFSPDGQYLASAGEDGVDYLSLYAAVTCVQFNPVDDNYFISGSMDGKVRIWAISSYQVVDWCDVRDIVTAVCYHPDGQGGIVGSMTGSCWFYNVADKRLQLDAHIYSNGKKKSPCRRITGLQFLPQDSSKVMVPCADFQVRIIQGHDVICKYKGARNSLSQSAGARNNGNQAFPSLTPDGKHIVSACEDANVYIWNSVDQDEQICSPAKDIRSLERFFANASIAIPWLTSDLEIRKHQLPWLAQGCMLDSHVQLRLMIENLRFPVSGLQLNLFAKVVVFYVVLGLAFRQGYSNGHGVGTYRGIILSETNFPADYSARMHAIFYALHNTFPYNSFCGLLILGRRTYGRDREINPRTQFLPGSE
ncbi:Histone-lysine N-methyltransferase ATXR6 [Hibiscus syriacus]|uniref:Histone-lysine N-methyltransferase ATXR6 n=1 Tax=Hibiscus syriacus TaxID=106335 RepID=A0A6A2Y8I1_HIBSY|nr:Histone-lysine N-methyltransferase ATXR6 [Hibiscus syriacus]